METRLKTVVTLSPAKVYFRYCYKPGFHIIAPVATVAAVVEKRV